MIRTLIVDDSIIVRKNLKKHFSSNPNIDVVGEAQDGGRAIQQFEELKPDLITLDIQMPGINGVDVLKKIKSISPDVKILMLSSMRQDPLIINALDLGAEQFLYKPIDYNLLDSTIENIMK